MGDDSTVTIADTLRDRTPGNGHLGCDALDPCDDCRELWEQLIGRPLLRLPVQRVG